MSTITVVAAARARAAAYIVALRDGSWLSPVPLTTRMAASEMGA